jgi:hypothetical protein
MTTPYVRPKLPYKDNPWLTADVGSVTFVVGALSGTTIVVNVVAFPQGLKPLGVFAGDPVTVTVKLDWYLSTDAAGQDILASGSGASGGVAAGTNGTLQQVVTGCSGFCVPNLANGEIDFSIVDASFRNLYLNIVLPTGGVLTSPVLAF